MWFPSYWGNGFETNWLALAWLRAAWKVATGAVEGRILDRVTGKHYVL